MPSYRDLLQKIRLCFPQPISDRVHDSYFVHSIMRALDQVDALKTEIPILGQTIPNDYAVGQQAKLGPALGSLEKVTEEMVGYLQGMTLSSHPRTQQNVVAPPSIPSLIGVLLASLFNPNLVSDEYSRRVALAEVEVVAMVADLVGFDPAQAGGVFTFGGTGTSLYGVKVGLEKAVPGAMKQGIHGHLVLFASDASHYCRHNIAGWLGLGANQLCTIPTQDDNSIDLVQLADQARQALQAGKKIACFMATIGSTDAFGLDDLQEIVALRDRLVDEFHLSYRPHVHADAVIGWAWSVFRDYSFEANPLGFRLRTVRALAGALRHIRHLQLADSLGVDFHKTGFCPYIASLFLLKDRADFQLLTRDTRDMPYLYQFAEYRPGLFTLETSRGGAGVLAALANLRLLGREGWQTLLGHLVEMAQLLREHLDGHESTTVLNRANFGPVTVFRIYPPGVDTFSIQQREFHDPQARDLLLQHNEYNRRVAAYIHAEALAGRGVMISLTDCYRHTAYGEPIVALKSWIVSPFVDEDSVQVLVRMILEARDHVERNP